MIDQATLEGYKSKWASTTIWGAVMSIVAGVLGALGYTVGSDFVPQMTQIAVGIVSSLFALAGGVMAFVGRIKAVKKVK